MNNEKTECIIFSTPGLPSVTLSNFGSLVSNFTVENLGVILDGCMKFDKQIDSVVRASFQLEIVAKLLALYFHKSFS